MGTAITDARRQPRLVGRRHPRLRRRARQGGEADHRAERAPGEIRARRHLRHERPVLRRRHAPERRRARDAGLRRRRADRVDGEHRALERRRRDGAGLDLERRDARSSRRACGCPRVKLIDRRATPIESVMRDHEGQQPAARLPARATCGPASRRRASASAASLELVDALRHRDLPRRRSSTSWTTASRCRSARSQDAAEGHASRSPRSRTAGRSTRVTVEITDDEFVVDLRDNPDQDTGPNNASPRRRR